MAKLKTGKDVVSIDGLAGELLRIVQRDVDSDAAAEAVLDAATEAAGGTGAVLVGAIGGRWRQLAATQGAGEAPDELVAEAADREQAVARGEWACAVLDPRSASREAICMQFADGGHGDARSAAVRELAPLVDAALRLAHERAADRGRIERLEAVLQIAGRWNQARETEPLLHDMAEAATRLLGGDRATIFLWDRSTHTLVGRPALGIEEGELRVPDDRGIVGRVVQTGEPARLDQADDATQVNRDVDAQLGYQTHTLVCVPMRSRRGELVGAFEVLNKRRGNFSADDQAALEELAAHAATALENTQERERLARSQQQRTAEAIEGAQLVGDSPATVALRSTIARLAETDLAVLVLGENGTGKEVVSRSIHFQSDRRNEPFVAVNCAAITETLLESELFGHEKGAFTDAREAHAGKFEAASGGTLFLDEIGDLSLSGQAKLLRVLEDKVVVRVGGSRPIRTDARVIAATNQDLVAMVQEKRFRQDLYFRLNVVALHLPPLRERREDVIPLAEHFLAEFSQRARRVVRMSAAARRRLESHTWPGNVRELRNLMERLAYLAPGEVIEADDVAFILAPQDSAGPQIPGDLPLSEATDRFQIEYIERAIRGTSHNMSDAARRLGLHRSNLYRKMRQLGMPTS